jgi:hypothetical protein
LSWLSVDRRQTVEVPLLMVDPLDAPPTRPIISRDGVLENPLECCDSVQLDDSGSMFYADLVPNMSYRSRRFEYLTDSDAMPARVRGGLEIIEREERVRHVAAQRAVGHIGDEEDSMFHGGHIIAVSLGGYPSGPNLFPQLSNFNLSVYARLERSWRRALTEGCSVEVDIALTVGETLEIPTFLLATQWWNGEEELIVFGNEDHMQ